MCLIVIEGKIEEDKRVKEEKISFTCLEGVREEKIKENNIFKLDICFYLNTPIKSKILVLVMDIIEILNVISGRSQKLLFFFIWLSLRKMGLQKVALFLFDFPLEKWA